MLRQVKQLRLNIPVNIIKSEHLLIDNNLYHGYALLSSALSAAQIPL